MTSQVSYAAFDDEAFEMALALTGHVNPDPSVIAACRRCLPSPPTDGFFFADEVATIIAIFRLHADWETRKTLLRTVGREVDRWGGFAAMRAVHDEVRHQCPSGEPRSGEVEQWHPAELECAWDGVGQWRW